MEKYKLVLQRESSFVGAASSIAVSVNGQPEVKMALGSTQTFDVDYKATTVRFSIRSLGVTTLDQTVTVEPEGYKDVTLRFKMGVSLGTSVFSSKRNTIKYEILPGERRDASSSSTGSPSGPAAPTSQQEPRRGDFCTHCGTKNPPNANFCSHCGQKL